MNPIPYLIGGGVVFVLAALLVMYAPGKVIKWAAKRRAKLDKKLGPDAAAKLQELADKL